MIEAEYYIKELERLGEIDPNCEGCKREIYPKLKKGLLLGHIHAPSHKPSSRCESGKRNHCTCDTCF